MENAQITREDLVKVLSAANEGADYTTDEALFTKIISDYEDYARLLMLEAEEYAKKTAQKENAEASKQAIEAFRNANGLEEDAVNAMVETIKANASQVASGIISSESLAQALRLSNYEADLAAAELKGRNAQIEETMRNTPATDGIPNLGGADASGAGSQFSIFELARGA